MKVLVIEDDASLGDFLEAHLPSHGFAVDLAPTGEIGISQARINEYDVILLDFHLPDMLGNEIIAALRALSRTPPILMLTVLGDSASKIRMLNAGADDYLVKPFVFDELLARIRALLRRSVNLTPEIYTRGELVVNTGTQTVRRAGKEIFLTCKEFALLEYLLRNSGTAVSKATLIEHVWNSSTNAFSGTLETHVANLRRKLNEPDLIQTVYGRGYRVT
jgi:DNA-binding response OmpR family regulator